MWDYGIGRNLTAGELKKALREDLEPYMDSVSILLLGTYGSILDTEEVPEECFDVLLEFVERQKIKTVIFETHCSVINKKILEKIQKRVIAAGIRVVIEMGYESSDTYVLENCLNKVLSLEQLCETITLIHQYSMEVSLNVFLGAPFLDVREQLDSAVESVKWAFEKEADSVVLFPCNIKPFTLIYELYKRRLYKPVSQWMLVELLLQIPEEKLNHVTLSWYGDRTNFYENNEFPLIPPKDCEVCHDRIFEFYHAFMNENAAEKRRRLIEDFVREGSNCECRSDFLNHLKSRRKRLDKGEIKKLLERIK